MGGGGTDMGEECWHQWLLKSQSVYIKLIMCLLTHAACMALEVLMCLATYIWGGGVDTDMGEECWHQWLLKSQSCSKTF